MIANDTFAGLCRARDMLRETHEDRLRIPDVAKHAGLSPFHFIRQFEALFGETPHQFRMHARLEHAKQLLAADNASVTDVCMEVGFSSLGSFSDLFTRRVGVAPSVYRRRLRTMVQIPGVVSEVLTPGCLTLMGCLPAHAAIFEKHSTRPFPHTR
jgi:AraC-like DNA-binding protein